MRFQLVDEKGPGTFQLSQPSACKKDKEQDQNKDNELSVKCHNLHRFLKHQL
jgi:hypothetical protein